MNRNYTPPDDELLNSNINEFLDIVKNIPELFGLFIQSQNNISILPVFISKIQQINPLLGSFIIKNNNSFFKRLYEKINNIEDNTSDMSTILPRRSNFLQYIYNTEISFPQSSPVEQSDNELEPPPEVNISNETNAIADRISEIFPHTDRSIIIESLQVTNNDEELAINYMFDILND